MENSGNLPAIPVADAMPPLGLRANSPVVHDPAKVITILLLHVSSRVVSCRICGRIVELKMAPAKVPDINFTTFYNIVAGEKRGSKSVHNGVNPVTSEKLWDVPIASQQDVDDAVIASRKAYRSWSNTPIEKRKEHINAFVELYSRYHDEFTDLLCAETGKPRHFADFEVKGVNVFFSAPGKYDLTPSTEDLHDRTVTTYYKPLGVVAGICPWNYPMILSAGKIAPALLCGNSVIIKPSPYTPYTALKLVELAQEIFPAGLVQVVGGDDKLGPMLTSHEDIDKISFTGSIATGKKIMAACAGTLKRCTLELGGNDACIVLPDVDIEKAAPEVAMGAFQNTGQVCVATKRIYVHESIYRPFVDAMIKFTKTLKVGASNEEGVILGPIQNKMQYDKVADIFADTKAQGYKFAHGDSEISKTGGYFVQPTIIDNPPTDSRIIQEEPFGK